MIWNFPEFAIGFNLLWTKSNLCAQVVLIINVINRFLFVFGMSRKALDKLLFGALVNMVRC